VVREDADEGVVLLFGSFGPKHVVEQQLGGVARGEPGQLQAWPVNDDLAEPAHLGLNTECHTCEPYASAARCRATGDVGQTDTCIM
jgi:hypothetical protein